MGVCQCGKVFDGLVEVGIQCFEVGVKCQYGCGVDYVLVGCVLMDVVCGVFVGLVDIGCQYFDQGDCQIVGLCCGCCQFGYVERISGVCGFDWFDCRCRDYIGGGFGVGQGCFEIQYVLQGGLVVVDFLYCSV